MRRCIEVGAAGFIPKTTEIDEMRDAIRRVLAGDIWTPSDLDLVLPADASVADMMRRLASLTPQQLRVLMMLSQGRLNKQIAFELKVSEATVKAHVSAILQKLGVDSRTQAVIAVSQDRAGRLFPRGCMPEACCFARAMPCRGKKSIDSRADLLQFFRKWSAKSATSRLGV